MLFRSVKQIAPGIGVPGVTVQEVRAATEANLIVEGDVPEMAF